MSDDPILRVSFGPVTQIPAPQQPGGTTPRLDRIGAWLRFVRGAAVNLTLLAALVAVVVVTGRDLMRQPVIIEEIALPGALSDRGYTGMVAAHRLWDALVEIQRESQTVKEQAPLLASSRVLDVVEPGTGLSLQAVTQVLRELFGLRQTRISGEVICGDASCRTDGITLRVRVFEGARITVVAPGAAGTRALDGYFRDAALQTLEVIDPYVAASYLYGTEDGRADAVRIARRLVRSGDPSGPWAANLLGIWDRGRGDLDAAIRWYETALELGAARGLTEFWAPLSNMGEALMDKGDHAAALARFEAAAGFRTASASVWNAWGNALGDLGRDEAAIEKFRQATRLDPDYAVAWNGWGNALGRLGRDKDALEKYARATELDPDYAYAWNGWGNRLSELGLLEDAVAKYETAAAADAGFVPPWNGWGHALRELGHYEAAVDKFRTATAIDPDYDFAWHNWALTLASWLRAEDADRCAIARGPLADYRVAAAQNAPPWFAPYAETVAAQCDPGG